MIRRFATDIAALVAVGVAFAAAARPEAPPEAFDAAWLGATLVGLLIVLPIIDPWKWLRVDEKPLPRARLVSAVLAAAGALVLAGPLAGRPVEQAQSVFTFGLVLLLAAMGNLFPAVRRNPYFGIRTPWTLRSDAVWGRTHRLFGHLLVGLMVVLAALWPLLPAETFAAVFGAVAVVHAVAAVLYSWRTSRRLPSPT